MGGGDLGVDVRLDARVLGGVLGLQVGDEEEVVPHLGRGWIRSDKIDHNRSDRKR